MLVWACIAPHGGDLIEELDEGAHGKMTVTREAMMELGRRCRSARPDTILVFTPHGLCVDGLITVTVTNHTSGSLTGPNGKGISAEFNVDQPLAHSISQYAAASNTPVALAAFENDGSPGDIFEMDFGALIPLWFMGAHWNPKPRVVIACPSRKLPRATLMNFGRAVATAATKSERRIAVICSADQGHGHHPDGPYGYTPLSATHDQAYCDAVRTNNLKRMLYWNKSWVEKALPDSYWQTLMLYGITLEAPLVPELLSYEAPTYFGMVCAEFHI